MIRRLNFTGRRTIARSRIAIRLDLVARGGYRFSAEYDLRGLRFPGAASVFIEAYNALSYMRFDFGTVDDPRPPERTALTDVTPRPRPKFRLKVVDRSAGLLLGVADPVIPLRGSEDAGRRQPLLPVDFCDLGERIWRLDLSDWPVLELNHRIDGIGDRARAGEDFLALVYPEVVRCLLYEIVVEREQTDADFDDTDWGCLWLRYICSLPGIAPPPERLSPQAQSERSRWVDDAVQAFCRAQKTRRRYQNTLEREADTTR